MSTIINGSTGITFPDSSIQTAAASPYVLKNRLINSDMRIDQRNAGASVTPGDGVYTLDRWKFEVAQASKLTVQQNAGSVTPPAGFKNYLGVTSSSAYTLLAGDYFYASQYIEGFNIADIGWGTVNAQSVTISFWVRSSLTGTFSISLESGSSDQSYPATYTINSANTWEQKSVTIPGTANGTWNSTNGTGVRVRFNLGTGSTLSGTANTWTSSRALSATGATSVVGTNGATFYITGVQLEIGTSATPFERRLYGQELALCQRYYYKNTSASGGPFGAGFNGSATSANGLVIFPVQMRASPTALEQTGTAANYRVIGASAVTCSSVPIIDDTSTNMSRVVFTVASGLTSGQGIFIASASGVTSYLAWSAEL